MCASEYNFQVNLTKKSTKLTFISQEWNDNIFNKWKDSIVLDVAWFTERQFQLLLQLWSTVQQVNLGILFRRTHLASSQTRNWNQTCEVPWQIPYSVAKSYFFLSHQLLHKVLVIFLKLQKHKNVFKKCFLITTSMLTTSGGWLSGYCETSWFEPPRSGFIRVQFPVKVKLLMAQTSTMK